MLKISYSRASKPSALKIAEEGEDTLLVNNSSEHVDVNWGRNYANATLNPDISNVTNKRVMRQLFADNDVPMPRLVSSQELESVSWNSAEPFHLIGRPDRHSKKRGYWDCRTARDLQKALNGTRKKKAATHFMHYVEHDFEFRVHVFNGKSIRISQKQFLEGNKYITIKPTIDVSHVRKAAKKAVKAVGLDFGAVDVLATADEAWVLEVNAAPGLGGSMPALYAKTFQNWKEEQE